MLYHRMPIEVESPEEIGYQHIRINLAESSVAEIPIADLGIDFNEIKLEYTSHRGHEGLRTLIGNEGKALRSGDVLLTGGAAMGLFIIHTSLLSREDHLIVVHPNYSSNLEVPKAIGCEITRLPLNIDHQWTLDLDQLVASIKPNTKLISLTSPHNPTGQVLSDEQITQLTTIATNYKVKILVDETYRDACYETPYPVLAGKHPQFISVLSFSKGFGLPGIRMGAVITQDEVLYQTFLAAKEMIQICNPPLEEAIAFQFYQHKAMHLDKINTHVQMNLAILKDWLAGEKRIQAIEPRGGVVCFARIKDESIDMHRFYTLLMDEHGTMVGPGHWFDMPDSYMRIGFGYTSGEVLRNGLNNISSVLDQIS